MPDRDSDLLPDSSLHREEDSTPSVNSSEGGSSIFDEDEHQGMLHQRLDQREDFDPSSSDALAEETSEDEEQRPSSSIFDDDYRTPVQMGMEEPPLTEEESAIWEEIAEGFVPPEDSPSSDEPPQELVTEPEWEEVAIAEGFHAPEDTKGEEASADWTSEEEEWTDEKSESRPLWNQAEEAEPAHSFDFQSGSGEEDEPSGEQSQPAQERPRSSRKKKSQAPMMIGAAVMGLLTVLIGVIIVKAMKKDPSQQSSPNSSNQDAEQGGLSTLRDRSNSESPKPRRNFERSNFPEVPDDLPQQNQPTTEQQNQRAQTLLNQANRLRTRNPKAARERLNTILEQYPYSPAADEAHRLLNEL